MGSLGDKIRDLRIKKNWTKSKLAELTDINASQLSRIESGRTRNPQEETLQKIANVLDVELKDLIDSIKKDKIEVENPLCIGIPHCLWSAPIIHLLFGPEFNAKVTSFGNIEPNSLTDSSFGRPVWNSPSYKVDHIIQGGPVYEKCYDGHLTNDDIKSCDPATHRSYTAKDMLGLLMKDELDCMFAAGHFSETHGSVITPIASILNTPVGCTLLCIVKNNGNAILHKNDKSTKEVFLEIITHLINNDKKVEIFYPGSTIASKQIRYIIDESFPEILNKDYKNQITTKHIRLGVWDESANDQIKDLLETEASVAMLVGWEPQLSWIEKKIGCTPYKKGSTNDSAYISLKVPLSRLIRLDKQNPPYLEYSLYVKSDDLKDSSWFKSETIVPFLNALEISMSTLEEFKRDSDSRSVHNIAKYINMNPDDCSNSLKLLDFKLRYFPAYVSLLRPSTRA